MKLVSEEEAIFYPNRKAGGKKTDNIKITMTYSDPNDGGCPFMAPGSECSPAYDSATPSHKGQGDEKQHQNKRRLDAIVGSVNLSSASHDDKAMKRPPLAAAGKRLTEGSTIVNTDGNGYYSPEKYEAFKVVMRKSPYDSKLKENILRQRQRMMLAKRSE